MKKISLFLVLLILAGCGSSNIKIAPGSQSEAVYGLFGKIPSRNFYFPGKISDSLVVKWEAEANGGFTQSSVAFYKDYVFVNDLSGRISCFDINTGKSKGQLKHEGAVYTTPAINKYNLVYIQAENDQDKSILRIHNFIEGREIAESKFVGRVQTELLMFDNRIYFITEKGLLYKYSHIGDMYWVKDLGELVHTSPVSDSQNIYLATDSGNIISISSEDGVIIYHKPINAIITSGLALAGDKIIAGDQDGYILIINKNTGAVERKFKTGYKITAVPVIKNNYVYVVNLGGEALSLDLNSLQERWRNKNKGIYNSTPIITDNFFIIPDFTGKLIFIDIEKGSTSKEIILPNRVKLSPVLHGKILLTGYDRGVLIAYELI